MIQPHLAISTTALIFTKYPVINHLITHIDMTDLNSHKIMTRNFVHRSTTCEYTGRLIELYSYSRTKPNRQLWAGHGASSTLSNFQSSSVFFNRHIVQGYLYYIQAEQSEKSQKTNVTESNYLIKDDQ